MTEVNNCNICMNNGLYIVIFIKQFDFEGVISQENSTTIRQYVYLGYYPDIRTLPMQYYNYKF